MLQSLDRTFLDGISPIDLGRLCLNDRLQAREFARDYGFDLDDPVDLAEVQEIHREAKSFLRRVLCPAPPAPGEVGLILPPLVERPEDLADLLVWASLDPVEGALQHWSCAVLRVMHVINQANHTHRSPFHSEIKRQILDRYRRHLHHDESGRPYLGQGPRAVPLVSVNFREEKGRDSLILKLLHKPDNLPQSAYDRVGVKIVAANQTQALAALQYIRQHSLANFAHITPGRSRNTLVEPEHPPVNPFSSPEFHSIQFTCQQLIKVPNPTYELAQQLREQLRQQPCPRTESRLRELQSHTQEPQLRFFFPYEVQILDVASQQQAESGESSHANYRLRQLRAVRLRVLGRLLRLQTLTAHEGSRGCDWPVIETPADGKMTA